MLLKRQCWYNILSYIHPSCVYSFIHFLSHSSLSICIHLSYAIFIPSFLYLFIYTIHIYSSLPIFINLSHPIFIPSYIHSSLPIFIHSSLPIFIHSSLPIFIHSSLPIFIHPFLYSFIPSYIRSSLPIFFIYSFFHSLLTAMCLMMLSCYLSQYSLVFQQFVQLQTPFCSRDELLAPTTRPHLCSKYRKCL